MKGLGVKLAARLARKRLTRSFRGSCNAADARAQGEHVVMGAPKSEILVLQMLTKGPDRGGRSDQ
ncbi:hypothetical protein QFZ27_007736 [Inquilinus ginsengisoli]|uniref:hypothetical protein n=1 Tax=Inquilinus ginsengisoli TaxID=363840 RepID=UPI003D1E2221